MTHERPLQLSFGQTPQEAIHESALTELKTQVRLMSVHFYESHRRGTSIFLPEFVSSIRNNASLQYGFRSLIHYVYTVDKTEVIQAGFSSRDDFYKESLRWVGQIWTEEVYRNSESGRKKKTTPLERKESVLRSLSNTRSMLIRMSDTYKREFKEDSIPYFTERVNLEE